MNPDELKARTKKFALLIIELSGEARKERTVEILMKQLVRAATSVGANYRSACKARSRADFISKITIVEEEVDECQYWLELLRDSGFAAAERIDPLLNEAKELTAIFTSSGKTAKMTK